MNIKLKQKILNISLGYFVIVNIMCIGWISNFLVIQENNGRMPVLTGEIIINTPQHFSYTEKEEVEFYFLSDLIHISDYYFSIGDIIIYIGYFLTITYNITTAYDLIKNRSEYL